MLFDFKPWKLDIDVDATRELYLNNKSINISNKVMSVLSENQKVFFESLGVDVIKTDIKKYIYEFPETEQPSTIISVKISFLMCGKFCEIPEFQEELYWKGDEKIFTEQWPKELGVVRIDNSEYITIYDLENMAVVFKHPYTSIEDEKYSKWGCGYVLGDAIITIEQ